MRSTFSGITLGCPSKHSPGGARLQIHHDKRCIRAACRVNNEDPIVPAIDRKIIDEVVLGGDRGGQIDDAVQLVGLRIPAYKLRRDAAAHPIVEHPDDSIDVGADAQNRIQGHTGERTSKNYAFVDAVARKNVEITIADIRKDSPVLAEMESNGAIKMAGAMYNLETGVVDFFAG